MSKFEEIFGWMEDNGERGLCRDGWDKCKKEIINLLNVEANTNLCEPYRIKILNKIKDL